MRASRPKRCSWSCRPGGRTAGEHPAGRLSLVSWYRAHLDYVVDLVRSVATTESV